MVATVCIIDGPRSAGKTTTISRVYEHFLNTNIEVRIHKTSRPDDNLWRGINNVLTEWFYAPDETIYLVDRFHLTEYVYSTALSRVDDFTLNRQFRQFDKRLEAFGSKLRYTVLMASTLELMVRTLHRPEPEKQKYDFDLNQVWPIWSIAVAKSNVATIRLNDNERQSEKLFQDIVSWILELHGGVEIK